MAVCFAANWFSQSWLLKCLLSKNCTWIASSQSFLWVDFDLTFDQDVENFVPKLALLVKKRSFVKSAMFEFFAKIEDDFFRKFELFFKLLHNLEILEKFPDIFEFNHRLEFVLFLQNDSQNSLILSRIKRNLIIYVDALVHKIIFLPKNSLGQHVGCGDFFRILTWSFVFRKKAISDPFRLVISLVSW